MKEISKLLEKSAAVRAIYSRAACMFKMMPQAVFFPRTEDDFIHILEFANSRGLPLTLRGGGSGLAGQTLGQGIIVDHSRYLKQFEIKEDFEVITSMGVTLSHLNKALAQKNLFFPPDPSSADFCSIGGMVGNNSKGARSVKYGGTFKHLNYIDLLLTDGSIVRIENMGFFPSEYSNKKLKEVAKLIANNRTLILSGWPKSKANTSGYNLKDCLCEGGKVNLLPLFVGSEGTLAIFLKASLKVRKIPVKRSLAIAEFASLEEATEAVLDIIPYNPSALELLDKSFIEIVRKGYGEFPINISPECNSILIVETDGENESESEETLNKILQNTPSGMRFHEAKSFYEREKVWVFRKAASPLLNKGKGKLKSVRIIEDGAVPIKNIPAYIEGVKEILNSKDIEMVIFGHSGDGNFHINPLMDMTNENHFRAVPEIIEKTAHLLSKLDGTLSGEHGDGRLRAPYLKIIYKEIYEIFLKIKEILDPDNILNPDVKITKNPQFVTDNFRFTPNYKRSQLKNELSTEKWQMEIERCHGCGTCRDFCPTAKALDYDPLSSRGRAHFLQAILDGTIPATEIEKEIEIFNSCLSCSECLKNCPTSVDISPIASLILRNYSPPLTKMKNKIYTSFSSLPYSLPSFANKMGGNILRSGLLRFFSEKAMGLRRDINIKIESSSFAFDPDKNYIFEGNRKKEVVLFYGCFGNIYNKDEETLLSVKILQALGITVIVPPQGCCGISKISRGFFEAAADNIFFTQKNFIKYAEKGISIVYTAPSCGLSIVKEHPLFFSSPYSEKLAKMTLYLSEFLYNFITENKIELKPQNRSFIYQTPCHSLILGADESDIKLLSLIPQLKLLYKTINCCGLSGTYGLQKKNAYISDNLSHLLKKELEQFKGDFVVTPCGSCKIQVSNLTSLPVVHPLKIVFQSLLL